MSELRRSSPIFIVGVPRSGTTLLSAMLGAHPRLVCGPETYFFGYLDHVDARALCRRPDWPGPAVDFLYSTRHYQEIPVEYGLAREELGESLARRQPSIASILSGMIEPFMERHGKQRWVEKTPDHLPRVASIRRYFPDSPIIRIIRDPRDVAASLLAAGFGPSNLVGALALWKAYDDRSARFFAVDSRCHTVRYEELVRDPEGTLREVCRAIDEPYDPAMLDTSKSARLVSDEPIKAKAAERVDSTRAGAWKQSYSEDELRMAEALIGDRLRASGYPRLGFEFSRHVAIDSHAAIGPHPDATSTWRTMEQYSEALAELVARGGRFWGLPGERPDLSLFLGDPDTWLGHESLTRLSTTARLARTIVRRRLGRVPLAWILAQGQARIPGRCAEMLSWLLPLPTARHSIPELCHPGDPTGRVS